MSKLGWELELSIVCSVSETKLLPKGALKINSSNADDVVLPAYINGSNACISNAFGFKMSVVLDEWK